VTSGKAYLSLIAERLERPASNRPDGFYGADAIIRNEYFFDYMVAAGECHVIFN
jgi:hypothetical protein